MEYLTDRFYNKTNWVKFTNDEFTNGTYKLGWSTSACYTQRLIEGQSLRGTFYGPMVVELIQMEKMYC